MLHAPEPVTATITVRKVKERIRETGQEHLTSAGSIAPSPCSWQSGRKVPVQSSLKSAHGKARGLGVCA